MEIHITGFFYALDDTHPFQFKITCEKCYSTYHECDKNMTISFIEYSNLLLFLVKKYIPILYFKHLKNIKFTH